MNKANIIQSIFCLIIILIALALGDTFSFFMPMGIHYALIVVSIFLFAFIAKKLLDNNALDEREQVLELNSYKFAYITTNIILLITIFYQSLNHISQPALIVILSVSLLSKLIISFTKK